MSSVTRFLRQIPTGVGLVNPATLTSSALDLVPASGNYVGNYPPGVVRPASVTGLQSALNNAAAGAGVAVIRDMGKTIFCQYLNAQNVDQGYGYFRQYQLLLVNPVSSTQGFLGGVNGNNFGVVGPAPATVPGSSTYVTFYLPTVVAGVATANLPLTNVQAGLQM